MPLPVTREGALLIDDLLEPLPVAPQEIPRQVFNLPPPRPTTNFFGGSSRYGSSRNDPYSTFSRVQEVRMRQEAEAQAQALMAPLAQIDPTAPDYPTVRRQLAMQFPLAAQSKAGKEMLDATDFVFQQSRTADPNRTLIQQAAMAGVTPEEIASLTDSLGRVDTVALGNLAGQRARSYKESQRSQPKDNELGELERAYRLLEAQGGAGKAEREKVAARIRELANEKFGGGGTTSAPAAKADDLRKKYNY